MPRYLIEGDIATLPESLSAFRAGDIKFDAPDDEKAKEHRKKLFRQGRFREHRFYRLEPVS